MPGKVGRDTKAGSKKGAETIAKSGVVSSPPYFQSGNQCWDIRNARQKLDDAGSLSKRWKGRLPRRRSWVGLILPL